MEVFAVDATSGAEQVIDIGESDTIGDLKRRMSAAFGFDARDGVDMSIDGEEVQVDDEAEVADIHEGGLESGARIHVSPSGDLLAAELRNGSKSMKDLPAWARLKRPCVLVQACRRNTASNLIPPAFWGDKEVVLSRVRRDASCFFQASPELRLDPDVAAAAVGFNGEMYWALDESLRHDVALVKLALENDCELAGMPEKMRGNKEIVLLAVSHLGSESFSHATAELRGDADFVMQAMEESCDVYRLASPEVRSNKAVAMRQLPSRGRLLEFASSELRDDREVVLAAMSRTAGNLQYASPRLQRDRGLVLQAVRSQCEFLHQAGADLCDDKEVALAALTECTVCNESKGDGGGNSTLYSYLSATLREDREVALAAVRRSSLSLLNAGDAIRSDPEVVRAAVASHAHEFPACDFGGLQCFAPSVYANKELVLEIVRRVPKCYRFIDKSLRGDRDVALAALSAHRPGVYGMLTEALQQDKDILFAAHLSGDLSDEQFLGDKSFIMRALAAEKKDYIGESNLLIRASPALQADKEVVARAVSLSSEYFTFAKKEFRADKGIALIAMRGGGCLGDVTGDARVDKEVVLAAVTTDPENIKYTCDSLRDDKAVALAVVKQGNGSCLAWMSDRLRDDKEVVTAALQTDPSQFGDAGPNMRGDKEVLFAALERQHATRTNRTRRKAGVGLLGYASDALRLDRNVALKAVRLSSRNLLQTMVPLDDELKEAAKGADDK
eukprot:TRINITY_DN30628_c0_g1_i1.p1 TRINITY_DN30628_c0_g1~~TRINITY_DN30628_c0_g1_i1.p1  ORF type:complete len:729 (+),score=158.01 TRINITY_DN30628_c0_g1_i1:61-2247(+)